MFAFKEYCFYRDQYEINMSSIWDQYEFNMSSIWVQYEFNMSLIWDQYELSMTVYDADESARKSKTYVLVLLSLL